MPLIATLKKNNPEEVQHNFYWTNLVQPQKAQQVKLNSNSQSAKPKIPLFLTCSGHSPWHWNSEKRVSHKRGAFYLRTLRLGRDINAESHAHTWFTNNNHPTQGGSLQRDCIFELVSKRLYKVLLPWLLSWAGSWALGRKQVCSC